MSGGFFMNTRIFRIFEITGFPVIYLIAVFLHFVFDITNGSALSILFGAVNESVWEHVKIFAAGYVVWAVFELLCIKPPVKKFVVAKTFSLYALSLSIISFFYIYTYFTKKPLLGLDIAASVIFVALSQLSSYLLTTRDNKIKDYFPVACMMLMLYFLMFFSFTMFPPKADLFKDPLTGTYGIIEKHIDTGAFYLDKT